MLPTGCFTTCALCARKLLKSEVLGRISIFLELRGCSCSTGSGSAWPVKQCVTCSTQSLRIQNAASVEINHCSFWLVLLSPGSHKRHRRKSPLVLLSEFPQQHNWDRDIFKKKYFFICICDKVSLAEAGAGHKLMRLLPTFWVLGWQARCSLARLSLFIYFKFKGMVPLGSVTELGAPRTLPRFLPFGNGLSFQHQHLWKENMLRHVSNVADLQWRVAI